MCKKAWCTCKVVVLLINLLLCLLFSLPSPSPSSLLKLPIVVIQKFCYHGNVTSHFPSLLDKSCYLRLHLCIERVSCRLLQRVARWAWMGATFLSLTTMPTKSPSPPSPQKIITVSTPILVYMRKFAVWSYLLHLQELKQNWMQGWHCGKRLIYWRPIFRLTKLAFYRSIFVHG